MRNVKRSSAHEVMVQKLATYPHPVSNKSIFPTLRELMVFAAVLGFEKDMKHPLQGKVIDLESRPFESSSQTMDLLYLIAIAHTKDVDILRENREDEMLTVFEEYANGGFEVLAEWLKKKPDDINGDKAILAALSMDGFLAEEPNMDKVIIDVEF